MNSFNGFGGLLGVLFGFMYQWLLMFVISLLIGLLYCVFGALIVEMLWNVVMVRLFGLCHVGYSDMFLLLLLFRLLIPFGVNVGSNNIK